MGWFRRKPDGSDEPDPGIRQSTEAVSELLDQHHPRASIRHGENLVIQPDKVLDNIAFAMERMDLDITTAISIEHDVVALDELATLVLAMRMGPLLAVHVVNTAMRIMSARYPHELVRRPLPEQYDLRQLSPIELSDLEHETAKAIFNQRITSDLNLDHADVTAALEPVGRDGQLQVFVALVYMYGTKIGAMKHSTGIG